MSEIIRLTEEQIRFAAYAGVERMIHVIVAGRPETHGGSNGWDEWQRHVEGAMAEMAVASYLDITWEPHVGRVDKPDFPDFEVRSTRHNSGRLILHHEDRDEHIFVLVTGTRGVYKLRGWLKGGDGKQDKYWDDPTGRNAAAFFVPQRDLEPMGGIMVHVPMRL